MSDSWSSAQRTEKLPTIAMTPDEYARVLGYKQKHNMKMSEVVRKAIDFFLSAEDAKRELIIPNGENDKRKQAKRRGKAAQS